MARNNAMDPWIQQLNIKTVSEYVENLEKKRFLIIANPVREKSASATQF